jgi:Bifunctional DNA primase/polymerase, N-terminal
VGPTPQDLADLDPADTYVAAVVYARAGWPVFPVAGIVNGRCGCFAAARCDHPAKHPLNRGGLRAATTDPAMIRQWWDRWPWANVAIRTGTQSGLAVVDLDPLHGGYRTLAQLKQAGIVPADTLITLTAHSGSGGRHLYYRYPQQAAIPNRTGRLACGDTPGIDLRGQGGYIIAAPSTHHSGRRYHWDNQRLTLADLPQWARPTVPTKQKQPTPAPANTNREQVSRYAQAAIDNEVRKLAALAGTIGTRNHALNRAAFALGTLAGAGVVERAVIEQALTAAALNIGLEPTETAKTITSGIDAGQLRPRRIAPAPAGHTLPTIAAGTRELAPSPPTPQITL